AKKRGIDARIQMWDVAGGRAVATFADTPEMVESLCFSPDGRMLAAGNDESALVRVWEVATGRERFRLAGHERPVECLCSAPDGNVWLPGCAVATFLGWAAGGSRRLGR